MALVLSRKKGEAFYLLTSDGPVCVRREGQRSLVIDGPAKVLIVREEALTDEQKQEIRNYRRSGST